MDITDTAASASCVKYSTSSTPALSVLDKIQHVAKMRVGLTRFSLTLVVSFAILGHYRKQSQVYFSNGFHCLFFPSRNCLQRIKGLQQKKSLISLLKKNMIITVRKNNHLSKSQMSSFVPFSH